tara:strand:+ start:504 stop:938 length:435 start_codon:yes stop_codon:yes gene_type:complete
MDPDFNIDKITLSCLVSRKHKRHLGDKILSSSEWMNYDTTHSFQQELYNTIEENREYIYKTFCELLDNPCQKEKLQHTFKKFIDCLIYEKDLNNNSNSIYDEEDENKEDDENMFTECVDLRETEESIKPSKIEYWKMQQLFRKP